MKRPWLLAVVFASCFCLSGALILTLTPSSSAVALSEADIAQLDGFSKELFRLDRNPYTAYWMQRLRQKMPRSEVEKLLRVRDAGPEAAPMQSGTPVPVAYYLTFPHTANGSGGGIVCKSTIVLINNSETNANGTIYMVRQNGTPLVVGSNQGTASSFTVVLMPGESYRLETDGTGALEIGWIEVVSDIKLSGSGTFLLQDSAGNFLSEVGVGDSQRVRSAMVFVDTTGGKDTSFAVCNPSGSASANIALELRRFDSTVVSSKPGGVLPPHGQSAQYVREAFNGVNVANFRGVLVIRSTNTDIGVITLRTRGTSLTSLPAAPEVTDTSLGRGLRFARIGDGLIGPYRFQTSVLFLNHSAKKGTITLEPFSEAGSAASLNWGSGPAVKTTVDVPAGGAVELTSDGSTNPAVIGWARVTSTIPITGSGLFTISEHPSGAFVSQTGVPDSPQSYKISVFGQVSATTDTGFGLTNFQSNPQTITLKLYKSNGPGQFGTFLKQKSLTLPGNGHTARFISEFFSDVPEVANRTFEGTVVAENQYFWEFTAITLRTRGVYFTSMPVAPNVDAPFAPKLTILASTLLEGSQPCTCFRISQNGGETPLGKAVIRLDKGQFNLAAFNWKQTNGDLLYYVFDASLFLGRLFLLDFADDSVDLFGPVTGDGQKEGPPAFFHLKNLQGGGAEITVTTNRSGVSTLSLPTSVAMCLDPGLFQFPAGSAQTINVSEEYESQDQTLDLGDILKRSARSTARTFTQNAAWPRIEGISPARVKGGSEIEIRGANFAANPADNKVTLEGKSQFSAPAEVLSATSNQLRVRLPNDVKGSEMSLQYRNELRVEVGGLRSNAYRLSVIFAPLPAITFGSLTGGADSALTFTISLSSGELAFMEAVLKPTAGSWITNGFTAGQTVGTLRIGMTYDLKVVSSSPSKLTLDAIKTGTQNPPVYRIEVAGPGGELKITTSELTYTVVVGGDAYRLELTQPVFRMPAGSATDFAMGVTVRSMPERTKLTATSVEVTQNLEFKTN